MADDSDRTGSQMVGEKAPEETLLLGASNDIDHRVSLDFDSNNIEKAFCPRSSSHHSWLRTWRIRRSRSPVVSGLRRTIPFVWSQPRRRWPARIVLLMSHVIFLLLALVTICGILFPSYSNPPQHYTTLRKQVLASTAPGRANPRNEKIFIAASLFDKHGRLLGGNWARSVSTLIDILGPQNVFLSIYENDPDAESERALHDFYRNLTCDSSLIYEHLDLTKFDRVTLENGSQQVKRIAMLAEVRNRALRPLDDPSSKAYHIRWDKLLYLNDIIFDPIDAVNLLFSTNLDPMTGQADYRAACAVDFINPFKFYDTYATRDLEGYGMGIPLYPWFSRAGAGESRQDVLDQKDAVRVKSCWGGMVAFEAQWFQPHPNEMDDRRPNEPAQPVQDPDTTTPSSTEVVDLRQISESHAPLRFRAEPDVYWDASECCLIHGDLAYVSDSHAPGIYMNPYVRVAYSATVLEWLPFARRFERLFTPIHNVINWMAGLPFHNPRRLEQPGEEVVDRIWRWDADFLKAAEAGIPSELKPGLHGFYQEVKRVAKPGQFCGVRKLSTVENFENSKRKYRAAQIPGY